MVDGESALLDISESGGQVEDPVVQERYIKDSDGFLVIYSVMDRQSLREAMNLRRTIGRIKQNDTFPMMLVGNHIGRLEEPEVSFNEGQNLAIALGFSFLEASSKERFNVGQAFFDLIRAIRRHEEEVLYREYEKMGIATTTTPAERPDSPTISLVTAITKDP